MKVLTKLVGLALTFLAKADHISPTGRGLCSGISRVQSRFPTDRKHSHIKRLFSWQVWLLRVWACSDSLPQ